MPTYYMAIRSPVTHAVEKLADGINETMADLGVGDQKVGIAFTIATLKVTLLKKATREQLESIRAKTQEVLLEKIGGCFDRDVKNPITVTLIDKAEYDQHQTKTTPRKRH